MQRAHPLILLIAGILCTNAANSEYIDGSANIRKSPRGEVMFQLYNDVEVGSDARGGEWIPIYIEITFEKKFANGNYILPDKEIKDLMGKIIGRTKNNVLIHDFINLNNNVLRGRINGWAYKKNFKSFPLINPNKLILDEGLYMHQSQVNMKQKTYTWDFHPSLHYPIDYASVKHTHKGYDIELSSLPDIGFRIEMNRNGALLTYPCKICSNIKSIEIISSKEILVTTEHKEKDRLFNVEKYKNATPDIK